MSRAIKESTRTLIAPDGWKLSLRDNDLSELYNLIEDPSEQRNVFYTGQFPEVIERCTDQIQRWQRETADAVQFQPA